MQHDDERGRAAARSPGGAGRALRRVRALAAALLACAAACATPAASAQERDGGTGPASVERRAAALERAYRAVVGVRTLAVGDALSNATLGRMRQGSGVVIDGDGLVLTIGYLVIEADEVDLLLPGERVVPASVVGYDPATGFGVVRALAPLRVEPAPLGHPAELGTDEPLLVAGAGGASLARMVSRRPYSGWWEYHIEGALFTAPPRVDHSGAALFSAEGELVGIGSLVVPDALGTGADGPRMVGNMFVPVDLLQPILDDLRANGRWNVSHRAWLGLDCVEVDGKVRVLRVGADSPARAADLRPGDHIAAIDGEPVSALAPFYRALWGGGPAERDVTLEVRRGDGGTRSITLHAVDRLKVLRQPVGV